jgi:peptidoglycan/xylan/chitin deacetylase (PgdA/CDA1 family)
LRLKKLLLLTLIIFICIAFTSQFTLQKSFETGQITLPPLQNGFNSSKVIILAFDDSSKTQLTLAKPILDRYGYKGSFFNVCTYVNEGSQGQESRMSWQDLHILQQQGHDIESHTMTHTDLDNKSMQTLDFEIGGSKQCLLSHGFNSTIFAYPSSTGSRNTTVVNVVSKYYDLARTGDAPMTFLHCNGYKKEDNCTPFNQNGQVKYENRYDIVNWSDRPKAQGTDQEAMPMSNAQMFSQFVQEVNLQSGYNKNGCINAIPIVVYHDFIQDSNHIYQPNESITDVGLFSAEMKYLHDNGFIVLKMSNLGFNPATNYLYIKGPIIEYTKDPTIVQANTFLKNC